MVCVMDRTLLGRGLVIQFSDIYTEHLLQHSQSRIRVSIIRKQYPKWLFHPGAFAEEALS